ncbi:MAG: hypothetical protein E4H37_07560 [Gemmatimonadales bacterium]|nr:MAG: hypothetical protein E4H37_07560 [Gemmatimonadales bacterium]
MPELLEEQRENWGTRAGFVLAAIGSAVGLGNLWGFPYKLYSYGGGAFLIPYIIGMVLIGVPVLILEFSLGHMTQRAAPDAFRGTNRRSEPIGWWGILLGFVIITYYAVILAYCLNFLITSVHGIFTGELPWAAQGAEGVERASDYFFNDYLQRLKGAQPGALGGLVAPIVLSLVGVWVMIYLCIFRGVRLVSKVVLWTVPLPWLMLLILVIRGLTLEGAETGLEYYLKPSWAELAKPTTWRFAFGQVFFSMSLAFGVMVTYASFLHRKSDLNNNAAIIGLGDLGTSFIAGIAVFATLGGMALATGQEVSEVVDAGPGLAFVAFPYALAQFPYPAVFSTVFFLALITLGIDSAFSIAESVLAAVVDKLRCSRDIALIVMSLIGLGLGLVYCTRGGLSWIGGIDDFINGPWGIALLGMLECVVLGWMYRISRLRHHANECSDWRLGPWWDWLIRIVVPVLLSALFIWSLLDLATQAEFLVDAHENIVWPNLVGLILGAVAPLLAVALSLIHSPGADTHAAHRDQLVGSRAGGQIGMLLGLASLALVCVGFAYTLESKAHYLAEGLDVVGMSAMVVGRAVLACGLILGVSGLAFGAAGVVGSEAGGRRPSKWARGAASLSVLTAGAAAGLLLALWVMTGQLDRVKTEVVYGDRLSGSSFAIMAIMLALIFGGLLWCFYRAIRAAGREAPVQVSEGMED